MDSLRDRQRDTIIIMIFADYDLHLNVFLIVLMLVIFFHFFLQSCFMFSIVRTCKADPNKTKNLSVNKDSPEPGAQ